MKTIEEKAKRYDEAIEKAKDYYHLGDDKYKMAIDAKAVMEYIFPELKESEDEKIRKDIVTYLKSAIANKGYRDKIIESWIAWLEKQGKKGANGNDRKIPFDAWSEEDEKQARQIERIVHDDGCTQKLQKQIADWLKSLKDRIQPQPKQEWSEEDEKILEIITSVLQVNFEPTERFSGYEEYMNVDLINWLKSLKERYTWKPSEEMLEALYRAIPENVMAISEDEMLLDKLYQGLKYGRVLSKN